MKSGYYHPEIEDLALPAVLHALSDPVRLLVVKSLAQRGEQPCFALPAPVAKSTLSHHLRVLREAGVTRTREEGTQNLISLRRDDLESRFPGVLDAVLRSIDEGTMKAAATGTGEPSEQAVSLD